MSIHPNAPSRPSKSTIADPQDLLTFLLTSEPRLRRKDAEREVIKRFRVVESLEARMATTRVLIG